MANGNNQKRNGQKARYEELYYSRKIKDEESIRRKKTAYIQEKARKGRMQARARVRGYTNGNGTRVKAYTKTYKALKKRHNAPVRRKKKKPINYMANPFGKDAFKF